MNFEGARQLNRTWRCRQFRRRRLLLHEMARLREAKHQELLVVSVVILIVTEAGLMAGRVTT